MLNTKPYLLRSFSTTIALGMAAVGVVIVPSIASAQISITEDEATSTDLSNDPLSGESENNNGALDLFHRLNLANPTSAAEYLENQREALGTEAESFRIRQQEMLRNQTEAPATPAEVDQ